jgi:hypothetical protein
VRTRASTAGELTKPGMCDAEDPPVSGTCGHCRPIFKGQRFLSFLFAFSPKSHNHVTCAHFLPHFLLVLLADYLLFFGGYKDAVLPTAGAVEGCLLLGSSRILH